MKKLLLLLITAVLLATAASSGWQEMPLEERFVRIQSAEALPEFASTLRDEPAAVHAVLLEYADDRALLLKTQAALLSHPQLARRILPLYGKEPEFREILLSYGDNILVPIDYFLNNQIRSLDLRHYTMQKLQALKAASGRMLRPDEAEQSHAEQELQPSEEAQAAAQTSALTAEQRGWYAVNYIRAHGHGFLGQFATDAHGRSRWIQTERFLEGATGFFTDGIRTLETKAQTGQRLTAGDIGWAAVDVLIVASAAKVLRAGKAATAGSRTAASTSRLAVIGRAGSKAGKLGVVLTPVAIVYVAVRHPAIINDALAMVAAMAGLPVRLVQALGWTLLLLPLLYVGTWLLRLVIRPAIGLLRLALTGLLWLEPRRRHKRAQALQAANLYTA